MRKLLSFLKVLRHVLKPRVPAPQLSDKTLCDLIVVVAQCRGPDGRILGCSGDAILRPEITEQIYRLVRDVAERQRQELRRRADQIAEKAAADVLHEHFGGRA